MSSDNTKTSPLTILPTNIDNNTSTEEDTMKLRQELDKKIKEAKAKV